MKKHLYKLPFRIKLWWAKQFIYMLRDLPNDVVLYNELSLWIESNGKPTTSSVGYRESEILERINYLNRLILESPDNDPRDAYEIRGFKDEIATLEWELNKLRSEKNDRA